MVTIVDSLVVQLGLDPSNFTKGQKDAADALIRTKKEASTTAKEMQASGAQASEFFSKVKVEALSLFGVLLGAKGIESFVRDTTKSLAQVGRDARSIGESVPGVVAFANAMRLLGGTASGATAALQSFASAKANWLTFGDPEFALQMGLINGDKDTTPEQAAQLFQAYIEKHRNEQGGIQKIEAIAGKLFPGIDKATLQAMEQAGTVANLNKALAEANKLGVPTPEMAERATKFQTALVELGLAAEYDGDVMLNSLYPGLTKVTDAMANFITQNPAHLAEVATLGGLVATLTTLSALRISASSMGLTGLAATLETIALLASRLGLIGLAGATTYEALHAGGLNEGEENTPGYAGRFGAAPGGSGGADFAPASSHEAGILDLISKHEDPAQQNIYNYKHAENPNYYTASGYWQITKGNWQRIAPLVGIDTKQYPEAISAPRDVQSRVALHLLRNQGTAPWDKAHGGSLPIGLSGPTSPGNSAGLGARPNIPPPPRPLPSSAAPANGGNTHVAIGSIAVHTQATDANGIAQDLNGAIVAQSNRGPQ